MDRAEQKPALASPGGPPSLWQLGRAWLLIGLQSFGGGTATLFLVRRAAVEQHGWMSDAQFTRDWAMCQAAPGINLLCITILIGWRVARAAGVLVALLGLLLPSVSITIAMTAGYAGLRDLPALAAALRGVVPATVGLGLVLAVRMAQPLLRASRREGLGSLLLSLGLLLGSALAATLGRLPVVVVLCGAGAVGGLAAWWRARRVAAGE